MISMQNVACTASFMTVGMLDKHKPDVLYDKWGNGAIELHMELVQYAEFSEKIVDFISNLQGWQFPGVYDYEVSEEFGIWFANYLFEHGDTPPCQNAKGWIVQAACRFFAQQPHDPELQKELAEKLQLEVEAYLEGPTH